MLGVSAADLGKLVLIDLGTEDIEIEPLSGAQQEAIDIGIAEAGMRQLGATQSHAAQIGAFEIGAAQIGFFEIGALQLCTSETGSDGNATAR